MALPITRLLPALAILLGAASGAAEPCGDVPWEGTCDGTTRVYCALGDLKTEECPSCCGWNGQRFGCLTPCPASCEDECKDGVDVFGCSIQNTHEFTCSLGDDGCTDRHYTACGADEICDESSTHQCRPKSEVDLCAGIPTSGVCQGTIFKRCEAGALVVDDCAEAGQTCSAGGCTAECPSVCETGQSGCLADGRAWTCIADVVTGCLVQAAKNCGAKVCHEGACVLASEIEPEPAPEQFAEPPPEVPTDESSAAGGCLITGDEESLSESTLIIMATLLGFVLFMSSCRRRDDDDQKRPPK